MMNHIVNYANYVAQQREEEQNVDATDSVEPINFERGPGMLPLLPGAVNGVRGIEVGKQAQEILRAYFLRHYRQYFLLRQLMARV
jgi:hypothetical protein